MWAFILRYLSLFFCPFCLSPAYVDYIYPHSPQCSVLSRYELQCLRFHKPLTVSGFLLTVSFQPPINSDWIFPLRCSSQLDLGHQAMNIFGNCGISQVPGQSPVAFCHLSLLQSLISYEACKFDYTHWYETIISLYCLSVFSMGLWFCYLFVCLFLN